MSRQNNKENEKLEQAIDQLQQENSKEKLSTLINIMQESTLYIPATLPPDTDPALMKKIAQSNGKTQQLPKGVSPRPAILENKDGKRYLPLFSSEEQAVKNNQTHPLILGLPFSTCMDLVTNEKNVSGIVINAFDQNIVLNTNVTKNEPEQDKPVEVTEAQLHIILRQQLEANVLPKAFFENDEDFLEDFKTNAPAIIADIYQQMYPEQVTSPYVEEDFDVMTLNIRDDLTIIQVHMPQKNLVPGTCPMILITQDPVRQSFRFFAIVKAKPGETDHVYEALKGDQKKDLGEAPAEGSELQYMIDLHEKDC